MDFHGLRVTTKIQGFMNTFIDFGGHQPPAEMRQSRDQ